MASRNILSYKNRTSYNSDDPAPINYVMGKGVYGSYDGKILVPPGGSKWRRYPSQNPLLKNPIFVQQGTPGPLANEQVPVNLSDDMFIFAKNIASPYCCPATYATSTGCVCTNKQQRDLIGLYRGNNKRWGGGNPDV